MAQTIKVKAFAVLLHPTRRRHLVWVSQDPTKQPATFHRLLGGHVEFGEHSAHAVLREISEELNTQLTDVTLLDVVENVFVYAGQPGHEVVFVYGATVDENAVPSDGAWFDDGGPIWVEWRPVDLVSDIPLYPVGVQALVDGWAARPSS